MKKWLLILSMIILVCILQGLTWTLRLTGDGVHNGWEGESLTLYVNGLPVLNDLTLATGSGPESYQFDVNHGDQITTSCTNFCITNQQNVHRYAIYDHNDDLIGYRGYPQPLHEPMNISYPITVNANSNVRTMTIGTGTSIDGPPMGISYGYERSASIYKYEQVGSYGTLHQISWFCSSSYSYDIPYTIYAKCTDISTMTPTAWTNWVSGATMVKQGVYSFSNTGWHTFILDVPFHYNSGNLAILVETNRGGGTFSFYPKFSYTLSSAGSHQSWRNNWSPPLFPGTPSNQLPNASFHFTPLPGDPIGTFSPSSWDFGNLPLTDTVTKTFTLTNTGGGVLRTTGIHIEGWPGAVADYYSVLNPHSQSLFTGQSSTLTVAYHPGSTGASIGSITAHTAINYFRANLFGSGWNAAPQASVNPGSYDFG
ncbi:MAG: choice-of-anchor D domain-containing protein, partial [Candidatus Cloacimonadaceae bacterium]|nr:choice-of-anchor D domain-containing protein [Candidatus Cloacimonadaceae bacterium]